MRPLRKMLKHSLSFGGSGGLTQPSLWLHPDSSFVNLPGDREAVERDFEGYVRSAYKANGIVFACIGARARVFSEARFQYQAMSKGRPGDLFGTESLRLLENPWPNGTTGELLFRMEQDASLAGNFYATLAGNGTRIRRLRPDWVTILTGSPTDDPFDIEAEVIGYIYQPRGPRRSAPVLLSPERVVHFSPVPDPEAQWRGMSWITPVVREVEADSAATKHKLKFFENGTTSNFVVTYDSSLTKDQFREYVEAYKAAHSGVDNAYKTIHLGGGADVTTVGADLKQLDFKATQGAGETRIAAASGAGAVVAMLSEGMQGSSLNAGNYNAAKRQFADMTIRPLWRSAAAALAKFANVPAGARLWYDARDISFLQEDQKDAAEILASQMTTIANLVKEGFTSDSAKAAVVAQDPTLLEHTGRVSVQLQTPGEVPVDPKGVSAAPLKAKDLPRLVIENHLPASAPSPVEVKATFDGLPIVVENHIDPTPVTIENHIDPTPVEVTVDPTPVTVEAPNVMVAAPQVDVHPEVHFDHPKVTRRVVRDAAGNITKVVEE